MAVATRAQIKTRIETLLDDITGLTVLTGRENAIAASTLPACEVRRGIETSVRHSAQHRRITMEYEIYVWVREIVKPESNAELDYVSDAVDAWIDTLPDFFYARQRLERNDAGLVFGMGDITAVHPVLSEPRNTKTYGGMRVVLPLVVIR